VSAEPLASGCNARSVVWRAARCPAAVGWSVALAVSAALALCTATARAAPQIVAVPQIIVGLEYEVAPDATGCPSIDDFSASVGRQLGYDPFQATAARHLVVHISRTETGFDGSIRWSNAQGQGVGDRQLSSRRSECSEIAANVAFAVAVQIQLLAALAPATAEPSAPPAAPVPAPPNTPTPVPAPPNKPTPEATTNSIPRPNDAATVPAPSLPPAARRGRLGFSAGLGASLALGVAPHPTGIGRIFGSGRLEWVSLELAVDGALPTTRTEPDGSGFSLHRFAADAAACGHVEVFTACLTGTLGRLEARGFGVDKPASPAGLFSQLGARIGAKHDFGERYFAAARLEGLVMVSPWTVTLNDTATWTTPRVSGLIGLDFGVNIF